MTTLEVFQTLALIIGISFISCIVIILLERVINPFVYRISYTGNLGELKVKYVKLIKEMSLTTYQEIFINIRKNNPKVDDIKIERIYLKPYTNLKLFNEKNFE